MSETPARRRQHQEGLNGGSDRYGLVIKIIQAVTAIAAAIAAIAPLLHGLF